MSDSSQGPGWWEASDGKWYPPESHPDYRPEPPSAQKGEIGKPRSTGLTILVAFVTFGIWTFIWSYWNGDELKRYRGEGVGGLVFLLFTIFLSPITMFVMANEVEQMYREEGEDPAITTIWGLWFLLPLIGNIIWYVRIQRALNEFWQARGGTRSPGLT